MKRSYSSLIRTMTLVAAAGLLAPAAARALTLEECIDAALRSSPDVRAAASRLDAARAAVREAASAYYPRLNLSANWARTDNPPQAFFMQLNQQRASLQKDFNYPEDTENLRLSAGVQWRLFDGGRSAADRAAAASGANASAASLASVRNALIHEVTKAYYTVLQARAFSDVQAEAMASIGESLRSASERFKAGSALKTDPLNLEVQLSQAQEELIRARNGLQLSVAVLNIAVGGDIATTSNIPAAVADDDQLSSPESAPLSIDRRPELEAVDAAVVAARHVVSRFRREYLPKISVFASVDGDGETADDLHQSYMAGAAAELNLFDGFATRSGLARAKAGLLVAEAEADRVRNQLRLDIKQAQLARDEAWQRLAVARTAVASAAEVLRITRERYGQGAAGMTELMSAQVGVTATRSRVVAARYDYLAARSDVERAAGGLWTKYGQEKEARAQ